jgi:hypothetical protein
MPVLGDQEQRARIVEVLGDAFADVGPTDRVLRIWIKMAALVPAILLCGRIVEVEDVAAEVKKACDAATGLHFPWDD